MKVDNAKVPLGAGMAVTIEIRARNRRILDRAFSPLGSEAMKIAVIFAEMNALAGFSCAS